MMKKTPLSNEENSKDIAKSINNRLKDGIVFFLLDFCDSLDIPCEKEELFNYANMVLERRITAKELLYELKTKQSHTLSISAESIISYPNANKNVSDFIRQYVTTIDSGHSASIKFVNCFNDLVNIFSKDIKQHLDGGGREVAALIAFTYITTRVLKKSGTISKSLSINKTANIFDKTAGAVRRILTRLRTGNPSAMYFIENGSAENLPISELLGRLKDITDQNITNNVI